MCVCVNENVFRISYIIITNPPAEIAGAFCSKINISEVRAKRLTGRERNSPSSEFPHLPRDERRREKGLSVARKG